MFSVDKKDAKMKKPRRRSSTVFVIIAIACGVALIIYVAGKMQGEKVSIQTPLGKVEIIFQHHN